MDKVIFCMHCKERLATFSEAASHMLDGHIVETYPIAEASIYGL